MINSTHSLFPECTSEAVPPFDTFTAANAAFHDVAMLGLVVVVFAKSIGAWIGAGPSALIDQFLIVTFGTFWSDGVGEGSCLRERQLVQVGQTKPLQMSTDCVFRGLSAFELVQVLL